MARFLSAVLVTVLACGINGLAQGGDDKAAKAILDKAIQALGGEGKLGAVKAATWKAKGTISFGGMDSSFTSVVTVQGLEQHRQDFEGEFGGMKVQGSTVLNGDKGWRRFAGMTMELDSDALAVEKRNGYLQLVPITLVPLKGKGFKVQTAPEEKVDGKAAAGLKVTAPDGKDFTLYFDKQSGLPVKLAANVVGFGGDAALQETTFGNYRDFDGIKKATKVVISRGGEKFIEQEITEFKLNQKVDAATFGEPK